MEEIKIKRKEFLNNPFYNKKHFYNDYIKALESELTLMRYCETINKLRANGMSEDEIDELIVNDDLPKYRISD